MLPVRCYTCNAPVDHLWDRYEALLTGRSYEPVDAQTALDMLQLRDECCRKFFLQNNIIGFTSQDKSAL